jgi:hypothetical protein
MAQAQKPDFAFRRNGRVQFNSAGASVQSTTGRRAVNISLQGLYCSCQPLFCSLVTLTGYSLHSLVSPSLLLPCVAVCHHISTGVYKQLWISCQSVESCMNDGCVTSPWLKQDVPFSCRFSNIGDRGALVPPHFQMVWNLLCRWHSVWP